MFKQKMDQLSESAHKLKQRKEQEEKEIAIAKAVEKALEDQKSAEKNKIKLTQDFQKNFKSLFDSNPENASKEALHKWNDLGPIELSDIIKYGDTTHLEQGLPFKRSPSDPSIVG